MRVKHRCKLCGKNYYIDYGWRPELEERGHRHRSCCPKCLPFLRGKLIDGEERMTKQSENGPLVKINNGGYRTVPMRGNHISR